MVATPADARADPEASASVGRPVTIALDLGWQLADIQDAAQLRSDLDQRKVTAIAVKKVQADIYYLASTWKGADFEIPASVPLREAFEDGERSKLTEAAQALDSKLRLLLHAADYRLGQAFDLGRALARKTLKPKHANSTGPDDTSSQPRHPPDFQTLTEWLADLATALPAHSARPVAISLALCQPWISDPGATSPADRSGSGSKEGRTAPALRQASTLRSTAVDESNNQEAMLRRQAKLWHEVLTGEKDGLDMLSSQDYLDAGLRLMDRVRELAIEFFRRPLAAWATAALVLVPLIIVVWLLSQSHQTATKVIGSLVAVATALGISGSSAKATLGRLLARTEEPLWQAELDTAIADAITVLPVRGTASDVAKQLKPRGPNSSVGP